MNRSCLILTVFFASFVLLLQIGCGQRSSEAAEESKSELRASEPAVGPARVEDDKDAFERS